jgi:(p)ppGpp synthase/HD superfamily hydrolase
MKSRASLLERAIGIAVDAHSGQVYPSPEPEPYVLHPLRVMAAVDGERARVAAVLHDLVEDSDVTFDQLEREGIPPDVLRTLDCLTRREGEEYSTYIGRVATDATAIRVKLADLEDNLRNNQAHERTPEVINRIRRYRAALQSLTETSSGTSQLPPPEAEGRSDRCSTILPAADAHPPREPSRVGRDEDWTGSPHRHTGHPS